MQIPTFGNVCFDQVRFVGSFARMKLDVVLSLEKFTSNLSQVFFKAAGGSSPLEPGQVSKHFKETEKRDLSRKADRKRNTKRVTI